MYPSILSNDDQLPPYNNHMYERIKDLLTKGQYRDKEYNSINTNKKYDSLLTDPSLTTKDKMQFLATTVNNANTERFKNIPFSAKNIDDQRKLSHLTKRSFYDDMSYVDDYENTINENSKYNGNWYRYVMENVKPFLSLPSSTSTMNEEQNENSFISNAKSVSKEPEQKTERKQRNSFEELWYVLLNDIHIAILSIL